MARARPPDFLDRLIEAGLEVFGTKGFRQTRMSDIAETLGVSQGTLYNYVEGKEALFGLLVEHGATEESLELPEELPIRSVPTSTLAKRLENRLTTSFALPALDRALSRKRAPDPQTELREILEELWARTEATRGHADALESSLPDLPRPLQHTFVLFRRGMFERYARYLASRIEGGQLASSAPPILAARFLVESVTVFARHCRRDPDPTGLPDPGAVRNGVLALLQNSLLPH